MLSLAVIASLLTAILAETVAPAHPAAPGFAGDDLYNGLKGPSRWGFEQEGVCQGLYQSPINIDENDSHFVTDIKGVFDNAAGTKPVTNYAAGAGGKLKNIVDTFKYIPGTGSDGVFTRPDGDYNMVQFHIHSLSEHRIHKSAYAAEIHFVHQKKGGSELAVIGIMVQVDAASSPFVANFINAAKDLAPNANVSYTPDYSEIQPLFKKAKKIYRYTGSLTTPPCTEGVKWHVLSPDAALLTISVEHFNILKHKLIANYRNTMPLYMPGDANWINNRKSDYA